MKRGHSRDLRFRRSWNGDAETDQTFRVDARVNLSKGVNDRSVPQSVFPLPSPQARVISETINTSLADTTHDQATDLTPCDENLDTLMNREDLHIEQTS